LTQTRDAISDPSATTLLVLDDGYLEREQWFDVAGLADRVIIAEPSFMALQDIVPGLAHAGRVSGPFEADCSLGPVQRAGVVTGGGTSYRITDLHDGDHNGDDNGDE